MGLHPAKIARRIKVLFGVETLEEPRHMVLDGGSHPLQWQRGVVVSIVGLINAGPG